MIEVKELCKSYRERKALQGISFSVKRGEILGLLGPNGAGKSTTMKILSGILSSDAGEAHVNGFNVAKQVREAKQLGAVSVMVLGTAGDDMLDHPRLDPFYAALCEENLALGVHVGWSCPAVNNLYSHIYPSGVIAFHVPLLMAFTALVSGGVLDRFDAFVVNALFCFVALRF